MTRTTDTQLQDALERLASQAVSPPDGRERVSARLVARRKRRRRLAGVTAAIVLGAVGVGAAQLLAPDRDAVSTTDIADGVADPPDQAGGNDTVSNVGVLPNLSVDLSDAVFVGADISQSPVTDDDQVSAQRPYDHLQTFRAAPNSWQLPVITVFTAGSDSNFGIGTAEGADSVVDVNGHRGFLFASEVFGVSPRIGWELADGTKAFVVGHGLEPDALVELARSMSVRDDRQGWEIGRLPDGLVPVVDTAYSPPELWAAQSLRFDVGTFQIELNSALASPVMFESRVSDYLDGVEDVRDVTVRGQPGLVIDNGLDVRVLWYEPDSGTEQYLILSGPVEDEIGDVIAGVTELSNSEWAVLLASADETPSPSDGSSSATTTEPPN